MGVAMFINIYIIIYIKQNNGDKNDIIRST